MARLEAVESPEPALTLALVENKKVLSRKVGFEAVVGQGFDTTGILACETGTASVRREPLGKADGVRVSLVCATGEDYRTETEVVGAPAARRLVARRGVAAAALGGVADNFSNEMDSCSRRA